MKCLHVVVMAAVVSLMAAGVVRSQDAAPRVLADGTRVPVRLVQRLSSETAKTGDQVTLEVIEDVLVNGEVVFKQGTPVRGTVVEAAQKRRMGRAGKLSYAISDAKTIDRQTIRLRATQQSTGGSSVTSTAVTTTAVAVFIPVAAPFVLLRKGKDLVVAEGTRVDAFVDGEHLLEPRAATAVAAAQEQTSTARDHFSKLTNADILNLKAAGFGDDLIIAKIEGSSSNFDLSPAELMSLKKSGITERVISSMLGATKR